MSLNVFYGQIMDPKMDAGMAGSGVITLEDAIESGKAPISVSTSQLIDIMDHLLACEVRNSSYLG